MDYDSALKSLRRLEKYGIVFRLENTRELLDGMGFDWRGRVVHVSGTNGKGSCASALNGILSAAGYRVGLYTSPELMEFTERIRVGGAQMPKKEFARLAGQVQRLTRKMPSKPTFFEATTAIALQHFADRGADAMVLEVGMGGRLDSTNVIPGEVSVVTNVALDHMEYLGDTVEKIAAEKAGIVSPGSTLVTCAEGGALRVLESECAKKRAQVIRVGSDAQVTDSSSTIDGTSFTLRTKTQTYALKSPLPGLFQAQNLACAAQAAEAMGVPKKHIISGTEGARWPGRLDVVGREPLVILDCAHNPAGMKQLRSFIAKTPYERLIVVAGFSKDKDWASMVGMLSDADRFIATRYGSPRSLQPREILSLVAGEECKEVKSAVKRAVKYAGPRDLVLVTGSIYVVGESMGMWRKKVDVQPPS